MGRGYEKMVEANVEVKKLEQDLKSLEVMGVEEAGVNEGEAVLK